jgi:hypothetical protein
MAKRVLAFAAFAGLFVAGSGCAGHTQKPAVVEGDPDADQPAQAAARMPSAPPASAPATSDTTSAPIAVRPGPMMRGKAYSFPVATLPGFEMLPDGGSRVFVEVTRKVEVEERRTARVLTYVLKGARVVLRNNENALVTVHFNTPVTEARLLPRGNDLVLTIDLRADAAPSFRVIGEGAGATTLQIDFAKGSFLPSDAVDVPMAVGTVPAPPPASPSAPTPHATSHPHRVWREGGSASSPTPVGAAVGPSGN